jgi:predicted Na+-dependent transporter
MIEQGGALVKWMNEHKQAMIQVVANIIVLLVSFGLFQFSGQQGQEYAVQIVSAILVIVNAIAYVIGQVVKKNAKNKEVDTAGSSTDVG